jgi:hypothetical protein
MIKELLSSPSNPTIKTVAIVDENFVPGRPTSCLDQSNGRSFNYIYQAVLIRM